MEKSVCKC